jgi:hypothetical protein
MPFSLDAAALMASSGNATSISFLPTFIKPVA